MPEVRLSQSSLSFTATKINEILTQTIRISNYIPDTLLEGRWEVAPHPNDPPQTPGSHAWISVQPANFVGNRVKCKITVDTRKLMANKVYDRQLLLYTNSANGSYNFPVKIKTPPLNKPLILFYNFLFLLIMMSACMGCLVGTKEIIEAGNVAVAGLILEVVAIAVVGAIHIVKTIFLAMGLDVYQAFCVAFLFAGAVSVTVAVTGLVAIGVPELAAIGVALQGYMIGLMIIMGAEILPAITINKGLTILLLLLATGFGITVGIGFILPSLLREELIGKYNVPDSVKMLALVGTGLPLAATLFYSHIYRRRFIAKYWQSQQCILQRRR